MDMGRERPRAVRHRRHLHTHQSHASPPPNRHHRDIKHPRQPQLSARHPWPRMGMGMQPIRAVRRQLNATIQPPGTCTPVKQHNSHSSRSTPQPGLGQPRQGMGMGTQRRRKTGRRHDRPAHDPGTSPNPTQHPHRKHPHGSEPQLRHQRARHDMGLGAQRQRPIG